MTEHQSITRLQAAAAVTLGAHELKAIDLDLCRFIGAVAIDADWDACAADTWSQCPELITVDLVFKDTTFTAHVPGMPWPVNEQNYRALFRETDRDAIERFVVLVEARAGERVHGRLTVPLYPPRPGPVLPTASSLKTLPAAIDKCTNNASFEILDALAYVKRTIAYRTPAPEIARVLTEIAAIGDLVGRRTVYHDLYECIFGTADQARSFLDSPLGPVARWHLGRRG